MINNERQLFASSRCCECVAKYVVRGQPTCPGVQSINELASCSVGDCEK